MAYGMPNAIAAAGVLMRNEHRMEFSLTCCQRPWTKHTFKAGVDINAIHELLINLFQGGGVYNYNGAASLAFSNWAADVMGINLGDGLTGRHWSTFVQVTDPVTGVGKDDFYNNDIAGFVEDSWKIRPNITLNLGVRYDVFLIPAPPKPNLATPLTQLYTSTINIPKNPIPAAPGHGLGNFARVRCCALGYGMFYGGEDQQQHLLRNAGRKRQFPTDL